MDKRPNLRPKPGPTRIKSIKKIKLAKVTNKKKGLTRGRRRKTCEQCGVPEGAQFAILKINQCGHDVCDKCILKSVKSTDYFNTTCPVRIFSDTPEHGENWAYCTGSLSVEELAQVLDPEDFEVFQAVMLSNNQSGSSDSRVQFKFKIVSHYNHASDSFSIRFKRRKSLEQKSMFEIICNKRNCEGFCLVEEGRDPGDVFFCPLCKSRNCLKCNLIHTGGCKEMKCKNSTREFVDFDLLDYDDFSETDLTRSPECTFMAEMVTEDDEEMLQDEDEERVEFGMELECYVCSCLLYSTDDGRMLERCGHLVCRQCLSTLVNSSKGYPLHCPDPNCTGYLTKDEFRKFSNRKTLDMNRADLEDPMIWRGFHCLRKGCIGQSGENFMEETFFCKYCSSTNCCKCNTIHKGESCDEYKSWKDQQSVPSSASSVSSPTSSLSSPSTIATNAPSQSASTSSTGSISSKFILTTRGPSGSSTAIPS